MLSPPLVVLCPSEWIGWLSRLEGGAVRPVTMRELEKICRPARTIGSTVHRRNKGSAILWLSLVLELR